MRKEEDILQYEMVRWFRNEYCYSSKYILFSVANEGLRLNGAVMVSLGLLRGAPDMVLLGPEGRVVFIENKKSDGRLTRDQINFKEYCDEMGHEYVLCRDVADFRRIFNE
jgi:hypothetical protein